MYTLEVYSSIEELNQSYNRVTPVEKRSADQQSDIIKFYQEALVPAKTEKNTLTL